MHTPAHFAAYPETIQNLLTRPGAANLVAMTRQGLLATLLPFVYEPSVGQFGALPLGCGGGGCCRRRAAAPRPGGRRR